MMRKYSFIIFSLLLIPFFSFCQTSEIKGIIADPYNIPIENAVVKIQETNDSVITDKSGAFMFANIPYGNYNISIAAENYNILTLPVKADQENIALGNIAIQHNGNESAEDNIPVVSLSESDLKESGAENVSSVLGASRDPFISAVVYSFSIARFRIRGYDDENFVSLMNGAPMNDLTTGRTMYYTWGGLNDVTRNKETSLGLAPTYYSFGGIGGAYNIDSRASHQRKQMQASFALSNRAYDDRIMLTYGSGILKNGWSFAGSFSRRWANEGYIKGTFYDGFSYFGTVEKFINDQHSLSFTAFASPTKNGRSSPAVQEMYDLAGSNYYNPSWGYQNGKVRNAAVGNTNEPAFILTHDWKIDTKASLLSAVSYVTGKSKISGLDWYNATDPRPDYYRNLPSFITIDDSIAALQAAQILRTNENARQINWDRLYETNFHNDTIVVNANGIYGDTVRGKRSLYILNNRVTSVKNFSFNTVYNNTISENTTLNVGFTYQKQQTEFYKEVNDLLGGGFYVDYNQYAQQDFPNDTNALQNDLLNPNHILYVGDKYGYDFVAHIDNISGWWQTVFKFDRIDFFFGTQISETKFFREGKTINGIFSHNSFGNSVQQTFINFGGKGGITYKANGRNYFFVNASVQSAAPNFADSYVSARTRDDLAPDLKSEEISSIEGGYLLKSPKLKGRAVLYYTQINNDTKTASFYHDDYRTFVNYTLTNIDKRSTGAELAAEADIGHGFRLNAVAALGQYIITDRPLATISQDNNATLLAENEIIYAKNFHVAGSPEKAYTAGLTYQGKEFWHVNLSVNYFDDIWISVNPARRTVQGIDLVEPETDLFNNIVDQQ
ncbi:MAG: TonB-dependent receptor, partial [Bacteroidota bacterium]